MKVPPLPHRHPVAAVEELSQFAVGGETAKVGDCADGGLRLGEKVEDLRHADVEYFIQNGMAYGLAKATLEMLSGTGEAGCKGGGRQAGGRLAADDFDGLENAGLAPPEATGGFTTQHQQRSEGSVCGGGSQKLCGCVAGVFDVQDYGGEARGVADALAFVEVHPVHAQYGYFPWDMAVQHLRRLDYVKRGIVICRENRRAPGKRSEPLRNTDDSGL